MPKPTRVVSVRVPIGLPEKVKATTGMPFSKAVVVMFEAFLATQTFNPPTHPPTQESTHD